MKRLFVLLPLLFLSGCPKLWDDPLPKEAERHRVKTEDGYELSLVHYAAKKPVTGRPVMLVHGISANERNMDLDEDHSLARFFASQGRDAWTLSLRGTGASDAMDVEKGRKAYAFDAFWQKDLPAAINYVREKSGSKSIDYVGHSMGGMVVYAYLSQGGQGLNAVTTLGSPTRLDWGGRVIDLLPSLKGIYLEDGMSVPVVSAAHLVMPIHGEIHDDFFQLLLYNPENVSKQSWKRLISYGIADIQGGVAVQFIGFIEKGSFASADGKIDFRKDMAKIQTPIFVVAGKNDRIATPMAVKDGYRALKGPKEWLLLGVENGQQADYGHMDLVMGDRAKDELWVKVEDFFDRHENDGR